MRILRSKLSIPEPASYIVSRQRLIKLILGHKKASLFLLIAPAGYGKSTVAQQVLSNVIKSKKAWYYLETQDAEPRRFLFYLLESLSQILPPLKKSNLKEKLYDGKADIGEVTEDLCFILQEYQGPPVWLVLDNWESVNDQKDIESIVSSMIWHGNGKLKLIFNSRVKPSFKFHKLRESGKAEVIDRDELAFNFPEFVEAVEKRATAAINEQELEKIWKITSGWCVNLGLILEMLQRQGAKYSVSALSNLKESESISGYLREELFQDLPLEFFDFLMKCSVLDIISPSSSRVLIDDEENINRNIKILSNSSIPHFALPEPDNYRLHPLIRQEANRLLRDKYSSEELDRLYNNAASYFIKNGAIMEALELLIDYRDYDATLNLIEQEWYKIIDLNGLPQVEKWLRQFPEALQIRPLYVRVMTNLLCIFGYNQELIDFLSDKLNPDNYGQGDSILCNLWVRYHWARLHSIDKPQYDAISKDWGNLNTRKGPFPDSAMSGVELTLSCGAYMELRIELALKHNHNALKYISKDSEAYRISVADNDALFLNMLGRSSESIRILEDNIREGDRLNIVNGRAHRLISMGWIYGSIGEHKKAFEKIEEGMETMFRYDLHNVRDHMYADRYAGQALWYIGDKEEAIKRLESSFQYAKDHNHKEAVVTGLLIEYYSLLDGKHRSVIDFSNLPRAGSASSSRLIYLAKLIYQGIIDNEFKNVPDYLNEIRDISVSRGLLPWQALADLFHAYLADTDGNIMESKKYLQEGLEKLENINWSAYPLASDLLNTFVYVKSQKYGIYPERAQKLAARTNQYDLATAVNDEITAETCSNDEAGNLLKAAIDGRIRGLAKLASALLENHSPSVINLAQKYIETIEREVLPPLTINTLGGFTVISNSRPVKFSRTKSKHLCQLLLIEYPNPIHEEVLMEHLWPEGDPLKTRANLQTCIKDLRKALDPFYEPRSVAYVKYQDEHYSLDLPANSSVDFIEFKTAINRISMDPDSGKLSSAQLINLWQALKLYKGEFLPRERYESFTLEMREHLQKKFLDTSLIYADHLIANNDLKRAIEVIEKGLQIDHLWSEGVQKIMTARARNGELSKALRAYRDYEKRLQDELGLPPDEDMKWYFENLINHHNH